MLSDKDIEFFRSLTLEGSYRYGTYDCPTLNSCHGCPISYDSDIDIDDVMYHYNIKIGFKETKCYAIIKHFKDTQISFKERHNKNLQDIAKESQC